MSKHRTLAGASTARNPRLMASLAVGVAVLLGTTGCTLAAQMGTNVPYSPSDGINVRNSGPLSVLNALLVVDAEGDGRGANFIGAVVNSTDKSATLTMQIGQGADAITETIPVAANSTVSFGGDDQDPLSLPDVEATSGETVPVFFQSGDAEGSIGNVPVLDGQFTYLRTLVPTPTPTPTSTPTPTPTR